MRHNRDALVLAALLALCSACHDEVVGTFARDTDGESGCADWYDGNWLARKQIIVSREMVAGALSDFPVLVATRNDSDLAARAEDDGHDLAFTRSDGTTRVHHEIEAFDGTTGELAAWVRAEDLSTERDLVLYLYYGRSDVEPNTVAARVWDDGFAAVWHLAAPTDDSFADSTANGNDGTSPDTGRPSATRGQIGSAAAFDDAEIRVPNAPSLQPKQALTIEVWALLRSTHEGTYVDPLVRKGDENPNNYHLSIRNGRLTLLLDEWEGGTMDGLEAGVETPLGEFKHFAATWDGLTRALYIDGELVAMNEREGPLGTDTRPIYLGGRLTMNEDRFDGVLDEVRLSNVARSAAWIRTSYDNTRAPEAQIRIGPEESQCCCG